MNHRVRQPMPFGAEPVEGGVRFRLWAPAARTVELVRPDRVAAESLAPRPDGWFELVNSDARAGTRYRYRINGKQEVPDPAARAHDEATGFSSVVDPAAYQWQCRTWRGRPWREAVIYELHVGTFSPEGNYDGIRRRLDHLADLGVTMLELMPLGDFPGSRGWGYDGVLPYAPDAAYGSPEDLKRLVDAAHERGLAMLLDVVYNHFGPEGNWLHAYAPQFFTDRHQTPWGAAINFDDDHSRTVRDFFIHNALYWLEEYRFDGLRVDAVHAMRDDSATHFIEQLCQAVRDGPGREREVHVVLENHDNTASLLGPPAAPGKADAQWNDDVHHSLHVILTGETDGYYADFADRPRAQLARALAEGFAFQGEISGYGGGHPRGEPSRHLPPTAFVNFLQTHDQVGNRALGDRLWRLVEDPAALRAAVSILLLAPSPPLLFMGEEWAAPEPFTYFCDFEPDLLARVRAGRKREFARFLRFSAAGDGDRAELPDPGARETFRASTLDWQRLREPFHAGWLAWYRELLSVRRRAIVPLIPHLRSGRASVVDESGLVVVEWPGDDGRTLRLVANLGTRTVGCPTPLAGTLIHSTMERADDPPDRLPPWSVTWLLEAQRR